MNIFCFIYYEAEPKRIKISQLSMTIGKKFGEEYFEVYPEVKKNSFDRFESVTRNATSFSCLGNQSISYGISHDK
jgi:hypothetical protein